MSAIAQEATINSQTAGFWRITAHRPGYPVADITVVRDQPTTVDNVSFTDPFGPKSLTLNFPAMSMLDRRGHSDLYWCHHDTDIDVVWEGPVPSTYPFAEFRWAGFMAGPSFSQLGASFDCVGALLQHDLELAKPLYPTNPIPYEVAIKDVLSTKNRPWLRTSELVTQWPSWWNRIYTPKSGTAAYLVPTGVDTGDLWTGLVTRTTGSFDPILTSYVQTLLGAMYTARGRWTIDLLNARVPTLLHRDIVYRPTVATVFIDPVDPGVLASVAEDWSQTGNAFFGQGTAADGSGYTGAQFGTDGEIIGYTPLAASRKTYPAHTDSGWFDPTVMRREVQLQLTTGLSEAEASSVGQAHQQMFSDPGITGTITLTSDARMANGEAISRFLIRAGMDLVLLGYGGHPQGVVCHVTASTIDFAGQSVELTIDSKFRDFQTVAEVMKRGKDALSVVRQLVGGQYQPPVPDQILPWNYADGSGYIPSGSGRSSLPLFKGMPDSVQFPWTSWTMARPPSSASWRSCYVHIPKASSSNANANWATLPTTAGLRKGYPIKMAQAGTIAGIYVAAYNADGSVAKVPFSLSLYYANSVSDTSMPFLTTADHAALPSGKTYAVGQNYPYGADAWETYNPDGTMTDTRLTEAAVSDSGFIKVFGTGADPAGYYPSSLAESGSPTGLLIDTTPFQFDVTQFSAQQFDPYSKANDQKNPLLGFVYLMLYCDAQTTDVYFVGRMYRQPPGTQV